MIYTLEYYSLSNEQKKHFFDFCKSCSTETNLPAHINMWHDDWQNHSHTLPFILEKTDRFKNLGYYHIAFDENRIVGCSGVYISDFCNEFALAGTRTWISKNYRNKAAARNWFLPKEKKWAIERNCKAVGLCFNEYNKNLIKVWTRFRLGERKEPRTPDNLFYNNLIEVPFPVSIKNTKQYVVYEKLYDDFLFDWNLIKWDNYN